MRGMLNGLLIVAAVYGVIVAVVFFGQRAMMYFPGPPLPPPAHAGAPDMKSVSLRTADGLSLLAWYVPPQDGNAVVVLFHGNAGNVAIRVGKTTGVRAAGGGVLLVEYRGYGGNPGKPSEDGLYTDGRAALDFLSVQGIAPAQIVLYGESLGGGVAVRMAYEMADRGTPVAALVLEATFSSASDLAQHHYPFLPVRWLLRDRYPSRDIIADIRTPLFMAHGEQDQIAPLAFARSLFDAARDPKSLHVVATGHHNDLEIKGVPEAVLGFLVERNLVAR